LDGNSSHMFLIHLHLTHQRVVWQASFDVRENFLNYILNGCTHTHLYLHTYGYA
jgi:hypothetical protein